MTNEMEKIKWGTKDALIASLIITISLFLILFMSASLIITLKEETFLGERWHEKTTLLIIETLNSISHLLIAGITVLITWFFSIRKYRCKWRSLGLIFYNIKVDIPIGIIVGFFIFFVVRLIRVSLVGPEVVMLIGERTKDIIYATLTKQMGLIVFISRGVIDFISVISQEVMFSGFLYPAFRKKCGILLGMIITAVIFWFMHFRFGLLEFFIVNFMTQFVPGLCFVFLYERRKTLLAPIAAHFVSNLLPRIL